MNALTIMQDVLALVVSVAFVLGIGAALSLAYGYVADKLNKRI